MLLNKVCVNEVPCTVQGFYNTCLAGVPTVHVWLFSQGLSKKWAHTQASCYKDININTIFFQFASPHYFFSWGGGVVPGPNLTPSSAPGT